MKTLRLTGLFLVLFLLTATTKSFAQGPEVNTKFIDKAKVSTLYSLKSDYNSIVESTMFVLLQLKNRFPESDYNKLVNKLNELALEGETPTIRYKAQLTSLYYNFYNLFSDINITDRENPEQYFSLIANKLENKSLASN